MALGSDTNRAPGSGPGKGDGPPADDALADGHTIARPDRAGRPMTADEEPGGQEPELPVPGGPSRRWRVRRSGRRTERPGADDTYRDLRRAWWAGAAPAVVAFCWVLMAFDWAPLQTQFFDGFFDAQGRAFLNWRMDVPRDVVGFEGFVRDGRTYIYFGPFPAIIRLPILAVTDALDNRLTTVSMIVALLIFVAGTASLHHTVRTIVRGDAPVTRRERWATAGLAACILTSTPFFLASQAIVYHEAALWGLALSAWAFDAAVRWQQNPTVRGLVTASALVTAAMLSRQSIALGALATLALAALAVLVRERREPTPRRRPPVWAILLAGLIPLAASAWFNQARLGQPFGVPMEDQIFSSVNEDRQAAIAANSSFAGTEYFPTTARTYLAPVGVDVRSDFPWLDFPREKPESGDDAVFDLLDWTSSLPSTAPALTVLAIGALAWTVTAGRRRGHGARLAPLWIGAAGSGIVVLGYPAVANRYLADLFPLVLVGGIVAVHAATGAGPWRQWARRLALGGTALLAVLGTCVNLALSIEYQRDRGPAVPESWRAEFIGWRTSLPGAREPRHLGLDEELPPAADGRVLIVGDCAGVYTGVERKWLPVERGSKAGVYDARLDLGALPQDDRMPVMTFGEGDGSSVVGVVRLEGGEVRFDILPPGPEAEWILGRPVALDGRVTLRVDNDPRAPIARLSVGRTAVHSLGVLTMDDTVSYGEAAGRPGVAAVNPSPVEPVEADMTLCRHTLGGP